MKSNTLLICTLVAYFFAGSIFQVLVLAQEPPLPPGLGPVQEEPPKDGSDNGSTSEVIPDTSSGPPLPAGLAPVTDTPPSEPAQPALPPGLASPGTIEADAEQELEEKEGLRPRMPFSMPLHGFWDTRVAPRIQNDPAQPRDIILGETRLQLRTEKAWDEVLLEYTGDFVLDGVTEDVDFDLRRLRLTWTPLSSVDVRVGRQVLTWGTGDLLFINDLFPKDFESFLIGRDEEYLKAPSDALRIGWYNNWMNVELVYTPNFDSDRHITGERISYYNALRMGRSGRDNQIRTRTPNSWFNNDEWALRMYRQVGSAEMAVYAYDGYWKSPGGQAFIPLPPHAVFPRLRVYGASWRQPLGKGLVNAEIGYYDSLRDRAGENPFINNSEFRFLIGYEREVARDFTVGLQYYLEHMMKHSDYKANQPIIFPSRDQNRHVFTIRMTKLLMSQNLTMSMFTFYSPSDSDVYFRPKVSYKINDAWMIEAGGNLFTGKKDHTFFGQLEKNSSVYTAVRYSF